MNGVEENRRRGQPTSGLQSTTSTMAGQAEGGTSSSQGPAIPSDLADLNPHEICSPHELIGWVDDVLEKLEAKFGRIEADVMERRNPPSSPSHQSLLTKKKKKKKNMKLTLAFIVDVCFWDHGGVSGYPVDVLGKRIDSLELSLSGLLDDAITLPISTPTTATNTATATHQQQQQPAEPSASLTVSP
ncbi:hypothetical protein VP01_1061g6 [Puccinia sorghi]|uniref:Uncharacterized protein n=1 Tax=Puccinia sorghi TaxID=27349 RepID=A0A0L6VU51_9BASI|nr:hypothetical protein VP01_1061g6 [Puccinia sorghi]